MRTRNISPSVSRRQRTVLTLSVLLNHRYNAVR